MPSLQVHFEPEMTQIFEDIRMVRASKAEPKTAKQIATDAVKAMHESLSEEICRAKKAQSQGM